MFILSAIFLILGIAFFGLTLMNLNDLNAALANLGPLVGQLQAAIAGIPAGAPPIDFTSEVSLVNDFVTQFTAAVATIPHA